jgi:hypothetical protein
MSQTPMTTQTTHGDTDAPHRCDVCGRRKEQYEIYHPDDPDRETVDYEQVCPRMWAHGPAEDQ